MGERRPDEEENHAAVRQVYQALGHPETTLEDVAWWMQDQLVARGLGSEFDMPSVYITGPEGIAATSTARIIQPGDIVFMDLAALTWNGYKSCYYRTYCVGKEPSKEQKEMNAKAAKQTGSFGKRARDAYK